MGNCTTKRLVSVLYMTIASILKLLDRMDRLRACFTPDSRGEPTIASIVLICSDVQFSPNSKPALSATCPKMRLLRT